VLCDASASTSVDDGKPRPNKHAKKQKPITELASAEILPSAAAADVERRTGELNPPGTSRGGLRLKYEQVKVFRDGNSLFHCARLAETWLGHAEKENSERRDLGRHRGGLLYR
jgi:hypothetical protein